MSLFYFTSESHGVRGNSLTVLMRSEDYLVSLHGALCGNYCCGYEKNTFFNFNIIRIPRNKKNWKYPSMQTWERFLSISMPSLNVVNAQEV